MAHFDTGASLTTIDVRVAQHLGLISTGMSPISTANGVTNTPNFAVDVGFLNTGLRRIVNLQVSSCNLSHFNLQNALTNTNDPRNFGVLIGRDIMSLWNIVWNGPTSTVLISD
ncbi:MAG: aspartyl protease family protein [Xanthomonadaceae bacterium]|nr:aspartyl protease family protein [Xanthomonadaceae bacterium]